jgi:hypothetical protein
LEKVQAFVDTGARHPLSAKLATEAAKRYVRNANDAIRLYDLVFEDLDRAYAALGG